MVSKGAQSRTKLLLENEETPTPLVSAAAELIKSLLSKNESPEGPAPDAEVALVRRFTEKQISDAFAYLRRRNFVYHGGSRKPFSLAANFKTALQVTSWEGLACELAVLIRPHLTGGGVCIAQSSR